jgi:predicted lipid carrier protein YhbT
MHSLPKPLALILPQLSRRLPGALVSLHCAAGLEVARLFKWLTPPAELDGSQFCLHVSDIDLYCRFSCVAGRFRPTRTERSDLTLTASLHDFRGLMLGIVDADTLFFQRRLGIAGDTELGLIVKNWLDATERPSWLVRMANHVE